MPSAVVGGASAPSLCFSGSAGSRNALAPLLEVSWGGTAEGDSANLTLACTLMRNPLSGFRPTDFALRPQLFETPLLSASRNQGGSDWRSS